jgi:hypothetical protein
LHQQDLSREGGWSPAAAIKVQHQPGEMNMRLFRSLAVGLALLALGGCTLLQGVVGDSATAKDALRGVQASLATYADVYQPAVLAYGHLPPCPYVGLCKDAAVLAQLKEADLKATAAIVAARSVLEGKADSTGQITAALATIQGAEAQIAGSGALTLVSGNVR